MRWETIDELEIYAGKAALERIHDLLYGVVLFNRLVWVPLYRLAETRYSVTR